MKQEPKELKVGDRVKLTTTKHGDSRANPVYGGVQGKTTGTILSVDHESQWVHEVKWDNGEHNTYLIGDLELVKVGKPIKEPPIKFLLQYELDEDPVEEFATLNDLKRRLQEIVADNPRSLKRDRIYVYEVKKKIKIDVEEKTTIKIKGI